MSTDIARILAAWRDEQRDRRTFDRQERWITEHFGEEAAADANYGWFADDDRVETKVYGHGVLVTLVDGPQTWFPLEPGGRYGIGREERGDDE